MSFRFGPGSLAERCNQEQARRLDDWPGHHYRLLAAMVRLLRPQLALDIGTFTGMSALGLLDQMPRRGRVVTFDVVPWRRLGDRSVLREDDFGPRLEQVIGDLADEECFEDHQPLLAEADLLFVDGPKDGSFEPTFLPRLFDLRRGGKPGLAVIDDIRVLEMVEFWHGLPEPKLDATSLGHWSGTGLVLLGDPAAFGWLPAPGANGK